MQVLYGEGVAGRTGPVPCATVCEVSGEALLRGVVGWVLSRESGLSSADRVGKPGRQHGYGRHGEPANRLGVVKRHPSPGIPPAYAGGTFAGVARGEVIVTRYADDTIAGFQHEAHARRFPGDLRERRAAFALEP